MTEEEIHTRMKVVLKTASYGPKIINWGRFWWLGDHATIEVGIGIRLRRLKFIRRKRYAPDKPNMSNIFEYEVTAKGMKWLEKPIVLPVPPRRKRSPLTKQDKEYLAAMEWLKDV